MIESRISIDKLIEFVRQGGRVKTGVDVYDNNGTLLLAKDVMVDKTKPLKIRWKKLVSPCSKTK